MKVWLFLMWRKENFSISLRFYRFKLVLDWVSDIMPVVTIQKNKTSRMKIISFRTVTCPLTILLGQEVVLRSALSTVAKKVYSIY